MIKHILMTLLFNIALVAAADRTGGNRLLDQVPPASPRLVIAHGRVNMETPFRVPANTRIVTFTSFGSNLRMTAAAPRVLKELKDFYRNGQTLFENNDTSTTLTRNGENLMKYIQKQVTRNTEEEEEKKLFEPSNHLPGQLMNNMHLSFTPQYGREALGEIDVRDGKAIEIKRGETDLKTYAEKNHGRTIFVFSCRPVDHIPEEPQRLMRALSAETDAQEKENIDRDIRRSLRVLIEEKEIRARQYIEDIKKATVVIVGLTNPNSKQYNGKLAEVIKLNEENQRYEVRLLQEGKELSVKAVNINILRID